MERLINNGGEHVGQQQANLLVNKLKKHDESSDDSLGLSDDSMDTDDVEVEDT